MTKKVSREEKSLTSTRINTEILREVAADEINFSRIPHGNKVDFWTGVAARVNKVVKKNKWDEEGEDLTERAVETRFYRFYKQCKVEKNEEAATSGKEISKEEEDRQTLVEELEKLEEDNDVEESKKAKVKLEKVKRKREDATASLKQQRRTSSSHEGSSSSSSNRNDGIDHPEPSADDESEISLANKKNSCSSTRRRRFERT